MSTTTTTTSTSTTKSSALKPVLIIIGIIILVAGVYIWFKKPSVSQTEQALQQKYDSLTKVDNLKMDSIAKYYNKKIDSLNVQVTEAEFEITQNNIKINDLEKQHKKQDSVVDSYDADQLQHFLANY